MILLTWIFENLTTNETHQRFLKELKLETGHFLSEDLPALVLDHLSSCSTTHTLIRPLRQREPCVCSVLSDCSSASPSHYTETEQLNRTEESRDTSELQQVTNRPPGQLKFILQFDWWTKS